ncbi:MAG TPA: helix-turn-helix domain-containing protein [Planctomycetota bacterium]|nr:helix-turn-helix domain-containing protein [Planctomycetota bacterium]
MPVIARPTTRRCPTCGCLPIEWLSVRQVADVLGVSKMNVFRKIWSGKLWGRRFGNVWRIRHRGRDEDGIPGLDDYLSAD